MKELHGEERSVTISDEVIGWSLLLVSLFVSLAAAWLQARFGSSQQETEQVSWAGFPRFFPANQIVEIFYLAATLQYLKNRPRLSTDESASIQLR